MGYMFRYAKAFNQPIGAYGLVESLSIVELCTQMGVLDLASDT